MRIAVAGATGNIGSRTVAALERDGHEVVRISRSLGVDLATGAGLDDALTGVDAVVDALSAPPMGRDETVAYFGNATRNLLAAEERAGVRHHVLLSILGVDRVEGNAHYAGKREQEGLVAAGRVPWSIVRAAQFHDFAEMVAGWGEQDGVVTIAPLLVQPIAPADVAAVLAEVATGEPLRDRLDLAGPDPQDLVDMARRTYAARGRSAKFVPTWSGLFGPEMAGEVMLPGEGARLAPTSFDDWLAEQH
ncbi:SDR family oxidoreductase [Amycolatopsis thermoflava]|uniref:SDR family oxidoreductase n=1 Tax=Amycolatopsis thermoflava TaxID=84480 RepID=UPI003669507E